MMLINLSSEYKKILSAFLFVLFLFTAGFFIQYGREAGFSGSWKYVINHHEEWGYWNYAQAHARAPEMGPNPFSYEERDRFYILPYPTTLLVGSLARLLKVNVLFFFPFWHIGAPVLIWFALFFSAWRLWKYPLMPSAVVSLILCLITLHLKGVYPWILTRFSRPADFLCVMIPCVSLIMNSRRPGKASFLILNLFAAPLIWMNPVFAITALAILLPELSWGTFIEKNKKRVLWLGSGLTTFFISAWIYYVHAQSLATASKSSWLSSFTMLFHPSFADKSLPALILFFIIAGMVLGLHFYKKHPSQKERGLASLNPLERLTLYVFAIDPLFTLANLLFPNGTFFELEIHRYMNFLIQLAVLTAWAWESFAAIKEPGALNRAFLPLTLALGFITASLLFFQETNFLLWGCKNFAFACQNESVLLFLICPLLLTVLMIGTYPRLNRLVQKRAFIIFFSAFLCFSGFALSPWNMRLYNNKFPFDGAYTWLKKNASPDDVVLSASAISSGINYLFLYTGLRSYSSDYDSRFSLHPKDSAYRMNLVLCLINGVLDKTPLNELKTLEEKIRHMRMDYVLIPRWSPFLEDVQKQLAGHLTIVYEDNKSILWRISARPSR